MALGGVLLLAATAHHAAEITALGFVGPPVVAWLLDGGLAGGVIYVGWRLREAGFTGSEYRRIQRWTVVGLVVGGGLIGLTFVVRLFEGRSVAEPTFPILVGTNGGALAATIAGYYATRSMATARKFEGVFDNTYQFTALLSRDGTITDANETILSFGGVDRGDVIGTALRESYWVAPYPESREVVEEAVAEARQGNLFRDQIRIRGEAGTAIVDFSVRATYDDSGEIVQLIVEGRDITRIERQQEHLSVLHRYLRHNLRNDLNTIQGYAALLLDKLNEDPYINRAETIHEKASQLSESSELVKQFAETTPSDGEGASRRRLRPILEDASDRASVPNSRIELNVSPEVPVYADERIYLVFEEFLNALSDHLENGGTVDIASDPSGDNVTLRVTCSGFEIPPTELSAFDRETERSSTYHPHGIRFWLLKSVVKDYGGSVWYGEGPDDGTEITLTFERGTEEPLSTSTPGRRGNV